VAFAAVPLSCSTGRSVQGRLHRERSGLDPLSALRDPAGLPQLRSRTDGRQDTEVAIAVDALNRMLDLGRPAYVRIA
jgi:hypothetical protein